MSKAMIAGVLTIALAGPTYARQQTPPPSPAAQTSPAPSPEAPTAPAQPPVVPPERVTFDDAVQRALDRNPSVVSAAADILRAEGLLKQARAVILPGVAVSATNTTLDDSRGLGDQTFTPQNTFNAAVSVSMPLFAPAQWARRVQAEDDRRVAEAGVEDVKRQIARGHRAGVSAGHRHASRGRLASACARHRAGVL